MVRLVQENGQDTELVLGYIKQAEELLREGQTGLGLEAADLPRGFDKELAKLEVSLCLLLIPSQSHRLVGGGENLISKPVSLQEACKLYCLCRLPYNEEQPMLGCDYCQEWFHYECVGLRPPAEEEDDEDVAPPDFRCPQCCRQVLRNHPLALDELSASSGKRMLTGRGAG